MAARSCASTERGAPLATALDWGISQTKAGVSLYKISKWLGHSDFKTTQIYAHLRRAMMI